MDRLARASVIAAVIVSGAFVIRAFYPTDRFAMVPAAQGGAFRVDRLTGLVLFCDPLLCRVLPLAALVPAPARPQGPGPAAVPNATGT